MRLKDCKKNTVAYVKEFQFQHGEPVPKFFILLTNLDKEFNVIVATFTRKLEKYKNKEWVVVVPAAYFQDSSGKQFPFEDSLLDCNTCCELSSVYLQRDKCKYIIQADNSLLPKICEALKHANKVNPYTMVKLQRIFSK